MNEVYGGIEAGGTKFVCAIGTGPSDIRAETRFRTTTPEETIGKAVSFFREFTESQPISGIGIASFGPIDPDRDSPKYGYITGTPKPGWADTDIAGTVRRELGVPVAIDTDTNGAALAEHLWGAGKDADPAVYLTVGTGIGGGGVVNGELMHGLVHPEMGHIRIPRDREKDPYEGGCPYHGDCLEGLASGKAMELRWGKKAEELQEDHPAWELEAHYLALGLHNIVCIISPQRIIMGGGVMKHSSLIEMVREKLADLLKGYVDSPRITGNIEDYVVPPGLGDSSGVLGAIALARMNA